MACPIHGKDCPGDDGGFFIDGNHPDDMYATSVLYPGQSPDSFRTSPLKEKYTSGKSVSKFVSKHNISGKKQLAMQGTGHRRRSYGPFDTFTLHGGASKTKKG